jgi:agmatine deiminase
MIRLDYIPYPLWRRRMPAPLRPFARAALRPFYPLDWETHPPANARAMAAYMARWRLLPKGVTQENATHVIENEDAQTRHVSSAPFEVPFYTTEMGLPLRLPAQWEPMERILLAFPVLYPPLWSVHAQMIAAISQVAGVTLLLPAKEWVGGVAAYLKLYSMTDLSRIEWLILPTDDIWIRDYGPFVGYDSEGKRAAVDAAFAPLDSYPQERDNAAARAWAAQAGVPIHSIDLETEGGNYWSDGAGTLLVSDELFARYPALSSKEIEAKLRAVFAFEKLIVLPRLLMEETGHVDLVCKLADAETVLVSAPNGSLNDDRLRIAAALLRRETNAQGQRYRVIELPMPPLYRNWWAFPVWRTYTNSLTVNRRVLVPIYGLGDDQRALDIYQQAMPAHTVVPINCRASINGGGAVHCLTKEVPISKG